MALKHQIKLSPLMALVVLAACSSGEKWPNLSDKLPDTAERNRVLERSEPTAAPRAEDTTPLSETDAMELLASIENSVKTAKKDFTAAMATWRSNTAVADARSNWMGAQLAVTRLSQAASRVNNILFNADLKNGAAWASAQSLKDNVERLVEEARQELAANTP